MDFGLLPPEVNSGLIYGGPGSGPMLAAAAGWVSTADGLEAAASGYSSQISGLAGQAWFGPSSMAMAAAAGRYVGWLQASAAQAAQTAAQAYTAAAAYETAFGMTVPPPVIAANRAQLMALIATNFLGQNTPAIAATEAQYAEMWVQDATAMYGYAVDSMSASTLKHFDEPPRTTNPSAQADQARAVAQSAGNNTVARTQSVLRLSSTAGQGGTSPVAPGGTISVGPGSTVTVDSGVTVTVTANSGATVTIAGQFSITTESTVTMLMNGSPATIPIGSTISSGSGLTIVIQSGTFTVGTGSATVADSTLTAGSGVTVTSAGGVVTAINTGTVTVGALVPATAPATASGAGLLTPLVATPGLAGTAGIQPQLDAEALTEFLSSAATAAAGLG